MKFSLVLIIYRSDSSIAKEASKFCEEVLKAKNIKSNRIESDFNKDEIKKYFCNQKLKPNIGIVLGGDGTFLKCANALADYDIPLLSFNIGGNLGFLTQEKDFLFDKSFIESIYALIGFTLSSSLLDLFSALVNPFRDFLGGITGQNGTPTPSTSNPTAGGNTNYLYEGGGYTGMGVRAGGVDGRGGFPAILHPNETVIDHTKGQGMGATVNFNISTVDAAGFDELLATRKNMIISMVNQAYNSRGKMGIA